MSGIDYRTPKATWTQKANGQWRVQIRVKVPTGTDAEGRTIYSVKRLSKQFSPDESSKLTTERKRTNALNRWIESLEQADEDAAAERERKAAEAEAERIAAEKERIERERLEAIAARPTVGGYVNAYIDTLEATQSVRPSAISDYRTSAKRIAEGLGTIALEDLTASMIEEWESSLLNAGRGVATVRKYTRLLNSVYKHAISNRLVEWNPCTAAKKPSHKAPSPNSLTAEQYARLTATLALMPPTANAVGATLAAYTGMRLGEVCGLRWKCYDTEAGIIRIENVIARAGGKTYESDPKTDASKREVPVHPELARMLARRRERMTDELEEAGITLDADEFGDLFITGTIDGAFCHPTIASRNWKSLAESFELVGTQGRRVSFHDLRHSFATHAIKAGADVKSVAAVLGHSDAHVTLNVYADATREGKFRAVELVGQAIAEQAAIEPYAELAEAN